MDLKSRARNAKNIDRIVAYGQQCAKNKETGQTDLFSAEPQEMPPLELEDADPWTRDHALQGEFSSMGLFLSGHPLDEYSAVLELATIKRRNDEVYLPRHVFELIHGKPKKRRW